MKKLFSTLMISLAVFSFTVAARSADTVRIDILYLNHGPLQPILRKLHTLLPEYGDRVDVRWYDFDSEEGARFKEKMGIRQHTPLVIYINGESTVQVGGKPVTFYGFPTGSGPAFFQGKWQIDDLKTALDRMTAGS